MKIINISTFMLALSMSVSFAGIAQQKKEGNKKKETAVTESIKETGIKPAEKEQIAQVITEFGDIKVKLYNETPLHRDNFIKLAKGNFFDGLLFHRVIPNFMIQGGDPNSRNAKPDTTLGNGEVGYTIPSEFVFPKYFHKRGALAGARLPDQMNPGKASSGCQFYIVQGRVYSNTELNQMEFQMNGQRKQQYYQQWIRRDVNKGFLDSILFHQQAKNQDGINKVIKKLEPQLEKDFAKDGKEFKFTEEMRKAYTTIGGTPHLDGEYTVFGEAIEGLDAIEKISNVERNPSDRPKQDVKMIIKMVE